MLMQIKIPLIRGHINVAMTLGLINILKVFGLVYVTTQGGPGVSSSNLPYHVYRNIFFDWNVGRAAGVAVITVLITVFITQTFFGRIRKKEVL
jgi:sorbitol/mannitol transport system permease protein